jgi:methyl-accepting chemotaxis protein
VQTPQETKRTYKRSTIFIKKKLQYYYMAFILASVLIGFLIIGLEVTWNLSRIFENRPVLLGLFLDEFWVLLPMFLVKMAFYLLIVILVSSVISHRMAGPIYKFEKSAEIIGTGDLTHEVFLRSGDQLRDLQREFNKMTKSLARKVKHDKESVEEALRILNALEKKVSDDRMKADIEKIGKILLNVGAEFKV